MNIKKAHIVLPVIPNLNTEKASVLIAGKGIRGGAYQTGDGIDLHCGKCITILAEGMEPGQIKNIILGCPKCGAFNAVVDIPVIEKFATQLISSELPKNSIPKFKEILSKGLESNDPAKYVTEKLKNSLPELEWFNTYLVPANAGETYAMLACIFAFVTWWQTRPKHNKESSSTVINNYFSDKDAYKDIEVNSKCPCGSGKKFKKCHGKN